MKSALRFLLPVTAAVIIAAGLLVFLWIQLSQNTRPPTHNRAAADASALTADVGSLTAAESSDMSGDTALLHLRQGDLAGLAGAWADAEKEYKASADAGGGIPALKKLAATQLQRRENEEAESTIGRLQQEGGRSEDVLLLRVSLLLHRGELQQAKQILAQASDSPQKHYDSALVAIIEGNHEIAKSELTLVAGGWEPLLRAYATILTDAYDTFAAFPDGKAAYLQTLLASALAKVQECEIALPFLSDVTKLEDDYRDAWTVSGYCNLATERYDQALAALEHAYTLDPEQPQIQYFLGRTYAALKDHKNAITFLQYALENGFQPEKEVRRAIAMEAQAAGDLQTAFDQNRALATADDADIAAVETFVKAAIQLDRKPDALDVATKAVQRWPGSARAYDVLGWAEVALGKKEEAKAAFERALQLDPNLEDAKQNLLNLGSMK